MPGVTAMSVAGAQSVTKYVRYAVNGVPAYGLVDGEVIRELEGDIFGSPRPTGRTVPLPGATLLAPVVPGKVIAVGLNYKSHLGTRPPATEPGLFAKYPSSIVGPGAAIVYPRDAKNLHYEGEMVIVIGRRASHVSVAEAGQYIFGITVGNDVSERDWQANDLQWFRGKASDTFGPLGPMIVRGVDYGDLLLQTRLNGEVVQSQRTKDLIFDVPDRRLRDEGPRRRTPLGDRRLELRVHVFLRPYSHRPARPEGFRDAEHRRPGPRHQPGLLRLWLHGAEHR
jgi:2-keto-4-pentenoate hydratase/2-oxohepta-3-ene-1,7-dioic acid hydratase in catechol pathway